MTSSVLNRKQQSCCISHIRWKGAGPLPSSSVVETWQLSVMVCFRASMRRTSGCTFAMKLSLWLKKMSAKQRYGDML